MSPSVTPSRDTNLLYRDLHGRSPELVVGAKGAYLTLEDGTRILDACAGAAVASIGHGDERVINAVTEQMRSLSYHHTSRLTNPAAEQLAKTLISLSPPTTFTKAIFLSSGSEANESALKLVRQYWVERGRPDRVAIISRDNSYHGNTLGCVSLTGIPSRRKHFTPYLLPTYTRVSPCYPYRQKLTDSEGKEESDEEYAERLGRELEDEILRIGVGKVGAFFAETVGGAAAGNLTPVPGYFRAIRRVCNKYDVLLVLDEIMCGIGRTGKFHAWEWEGSPSEVAPDIQTVGKGLNGGYMPLSAVLMSEKIVEGLRMGSGAFANGQTFQCHPAAAAAGIAVMKVFEKDGVVENCAKRGKELYAQLVESVGSHPNVGDIRGRGLFLSLEFVMDKRTKSTFPVDLPLAAMLDNAMFRRGVSIYSGFGKGTADGIVGDHILFSPPLTITSEEVELIVKATKEAVEEVFALDVVQRAMKA